ncbi:hypothetical protein PV327_002594 [Microctonus hyperodae]|uniref:Vitellogenin domain-containing protein n=1 Tax=Microctonus hyperodae TaxID=165561 RepID=A0AA39FFX6_MICHY|nr:hypothetical protein PV327_002594 [Microctonus hyperodae]
MYPDKKILFVILIILCITNANNIFESGKKYTYSYVAESNSGVLLPSRAASSWGFQGQLDIQAFDNVVQLQLKNLETFLWNGQLGKRSRVAQVKEQGTELLKPFQVIYDEGLVTNFSVEVEPLWATNIKRSIAGVLQLNLRTLDKEVAFHSKENTHYGHCIIEYVVSPESNNEQWIQKFIEPNLCLYHQHWTWTNVPRMQCPTADESPVIKSSERLYKVKLDENNATRIMFINATGGIYVQPFQSLGEAQFLFTRQIFELIEVNDADKNATSDKFIEVSLQHQLPDNDMSQGRATYEKKDIFNEVAKLLDRLNQRLENPGLDTEIDNLHNKTISQLLNYLGKLNKSDLQATYNNISGTSYIEETIRNMFLEAVPQIGTHDSALFVLNLIQRRKVSDITAMQLLTQLPFHIRKPNVELLVSLQPLINLSERISHQVRNTGILAFGTLIYKTCLVYCPYEVLDDYVKLYLDKFTEIDVYEKKMVWLEGLANIQLGRVVEFLEPIASGNTAQSRHLRVLAAWASLPTAPLRPDVIYPVYWPILVNRTEHLEMRIAALTLLIVSNPTPNRIISLFWYMQSESNLHLINYFYTTLKSMERTNFPCYKHLGAIAVQFSRVLQKPKTDENIITGNYIFDYQDTRRNFGAMMQNIIIASPRSNIPEVAYVTLNSHGSGTHFNQISLYIKATGVMHSLSGFLEQPGRVKDILNSFKLDEKSKDPVQVDIIVRVQQKAVLCLHFNKTNIDHAFTYLQSLPENTYHRLQNMEFHINQQRINVPLMMESIQVTDLGTNVRLSASANSLFSIRGNFTHIFGGRNNHVILRTAIHGTEVVETYNPLYDIWHSAERAQSIHGYFPTNVTVGLQDRLFLSYNTPAEHLRTGVTAHTRTTTTISGVKAREKLNSICHQCPTMYTVMKHPNAKLKDVVIFDSIVPELGGRVEVKVYDCEAQVARDEILTDIWTSHRSNYQTWYVARAPLLALHFLDYFSYVPPKGSCGMAVHIEPSNIQPSEVKFEYSRTGKHHVLSLTRSELGTMNILQQWNIATLYESPTWLSDSLKIKASRFVPGEKVVKVCAEIERVTPWTWDCFSLKPSDEASIKLNVIWGLSDTAKGKCSGSSLMVNMVGEVSEEQKEESRIEKWPYSACRAQTNDKLSVSYSEACYQASRELSTLRKYQVFIRAENLPEKTSQLLWRLRAFYDVMGGNSNYSAGIDNFIIGATFPKDDSKAEVRVNHNIIPIKYDPYFVDLFLIRTRLHQYLDNPIIREFFSPCVLTPISVKSAHNVTRTIKQDHEFLVIGQCYTENPGFALTAISTSSGVILNIYHGTDHIKIVPDNDGGAIYNSTERLTLTRDFEWKTFNDKRFRLDKNAIYIFLGNILPFIQFTKDQILLFFPSYIQEFSCGMCTARDFKTPNLYEKI